jgi:hypothetical protein
VLELQPPPVFGSRAAAEASSKADVALSAHRETLDAVAAASRVARQAKPSAAPSSSSSSAAATKPDKSDFNYISDVMHRVAALPNTGGFVDLNGNSTTPAAAAPSIPPSNYLREGRHGSPGRVKVGRASSSATSQQPTRFSQTTPR